MVADLTMQHVAPLVEALRSLYYIDADMISEAIRRKSCFNVVYLERSFKVDVFVQRGRRYDRAAFERSTELPIDEGDPDSRFLVASAEDIVLSKLEWFRLGDEVSEQQWRDVIGVLKVQQDALDRPYLEKWAAELGVADLLHKALSEAKT